jgi:PAS domain S-box-containing protein
MELTTPDNAGEKRVVSVRCGEAHEHEPTRTSDVQRALALELAELGTWSFSLVDGSGNLDERAARIVGLPSGNFANVAEAQMAGTHPDDLAPMQAAVQAGIASGKPFDLSYRVVHPDGSVHHVASRGLTLTDDTGRPVLVVGTNRDVTAEREAEARLRASEARYRALFEAVNQGFMVLEVIFETAPDGSERAVDIRYLEINPAVERQTGIRQDAVGRTAREIFPGIELSRFEPHARVALTGEPAQFEARDYTFGRWFDVHAFRVGDPEQRRVAVLFTDVTERHHAEAERESLLRQLSEEQQQLQLLLAESERARADADAARREAEASRADAEAANHAKSEFLAVMSHELRTPLNAIGGYADLIEMGIRGPVTAQQREDLRRVQASQRHLLGLINEVLNYAKLETGTVHFDLTSVRVREALAGAEALVAPQAAAKGLTLHVATPPPPPPPPSSGDADAPLVVRADAEKLRQILVNLLSNAVKFTDRGGRVTLECSASAEVVRLGVRDTGIGIAADQLDRIFDPFVQVRSDLTRTAEGTGLGLAISRDLARGMSGDLTVESTPGVGSVFTLTLPRAG